MASKIVNGKVILEPEMLPKATLKQPLRLCNEVKVGAKNQLHEPSNRLDVTGYTFFYDTPKLWNHKLTAVQAN